MAWSRAVSRQENRRARNRPLPMGKVGNALERSGTSIIKALQTMEVRVPLTSRSRFIGRTAGALLDPVPTRQRRTARVTAHSPWKST